MKNLLAFTFSALAMSLFAESKFISGTGFEQDFNTPGAIDLTTSSQFDGPMWGTVTGNINTRDIATIVEYEDDSALDAPELPAANATYTPDDAIMERSYAYTNELGRNTRYLELNSGDTTVARHVVNGVKPLTLDDEGVYVDAMVQFTATDIQPEPLVNVDKLLVWLYKQPDEPAVTNLMITAGSYSGVNYNGRVEYAIPTDCVEIKPNQWYHLTITMEQYYYSNFNSNWRTVRFKVYIDGKQVAAEDGTSAFMSMVPYNQGATPYRYNELRQIGFTGEGAVENIMFVTGTPYPIEEIAYAITVDDGIEGFSYSTNETDWVQAEIVGGVCTISDVAYLRKTIHIGEISYKDGFTYDPTSPVSAVVNEEGGLALSSRPLGFLITPADGESFGCSVIEDFAPGGVIDGSMTIALTADYTISDEEVMVMMGAGNEITLDLMGFTLTAGGQKLLVSDSKFIVADSVGGGKIIMPSSGDAIINVYSGGVEIADADVTLDGGPILVFTGGRIAINGGKFSDLPIDELSAPIPARAYYPRGGYALGKDTGERYYTLKEADDEVVPADEVADLEYQGDDAEEAAEAAAGSIIIAPPSKAGLDADETAAYSGYVRAKAVDKGNGKWGLCVMFKDDVVDALQDAVDAGVANVLASEGDEVSVAVVPGLYYTREQGDELPPQESETKLAPSKAETLSFTIRRGATGFYRIIVSPTRP